MSYSTKEIKGLIKNYHELVEAKDTTRYGLDVLIRLADLERAIDALKATDSMLASVAILGTRGETTREMGTRLGLSHVTIQTKLGEAVDWMVRYLNEGVTY